MRSMPMFPLGTVLLPGEPLRLHVFEPRYVALVRGILAGRLEPEFGVVLITRGSEVGGADERTDVGTIAGVLRLDELPGDRFSVQCAAGERIRIERWLPDDPYPRAEVSEWPDGSDAAEDSDAGAALAIVLRRLTELYGLAGELAARSGRPGELPDPLDGLPDDPTERSFALAARAGLGDTDRQAVLTAPGPVQRLALLATALDDRIAALRFALS
jgi:Lon protease-like protein